ncbi:MAG: hydrogenase nickel incorporation protein HypB [Spirochaetales bacterium]|nr:hydrogenase nickel incorporation protein HypB [Spirochaetales bacterium]
MDNYKVIEIKKSVYENNDKKAELVRSKLKDDGVFLLNLMSSPGSGKTTTVMGTIDALKTQFNMAVLEADLDSAVDAETVSKSGVKVIQLHTGGMCHLDAGMTSQGIEAIGLDGIDLAILENVGNLICPAEFDTGASKSAMILSVPEGDDKPLKYPTMFTKVDVLIINKMDAAEFFNFNLDAVKKYVKDLNPDVKIFPLSAKTGEGMSDWTNWLKTEVLKWKEN